MASQKLFELIGTDYSVRKQMLFGIIIYIFASSEHYDNMTPML